MGYVLLGLFGHGAFRITAFLVPAPVRGCMPPPCPPQDPGKLSAELVADAMESTYFVPETMSVWNVLEEVGVPCRTGVHVGKLVC